MNDLFNSNYAGAIFSPCRTWRYVLHRIWDPALPIAMLIGLNPSKADEKENDPTITREIDFVRSWKYGGFWKLNLHAFCATKPKDMMAAADSVGPDNDLYIREYARKAALIVCAWGADGGYKGRDADVLKLLDGYELHCLGVTKSGDPRHPLFLRKTMRLELFTVPQ